MGCPEGTGLLVVDHYGLDHSFEASCRGWAERILVIDDLANRAHDADFLIDQTYGRTAKDYETLVPGSCRLLLGSAHTLLRPEFAACREASVERRNASTALHRILVSVGSREPCNFTQIVLDGIARSNAGAAVDVVLGSSAPGLQGVRAKAECSAGEIKVHTDVCAGELSELMMRADLAIGSGGIAIWERCCLGMPSLVVCAADNQRDVVDHLATAGAIRLLGDAADVGAEQIADAVTAMAEDDDARRKLGRAASRICDGKGVERVMDAVLAEIG